ncbi:pleckstrin homology domain-containing family M member 1 [Pelobates fuscus]|uniref:pleckstrin homology domain-containing family M member 1 n=1 Tax=Pelobates fuscus TaxID=191477 RepID=UPI002FE4E95E
MYSPFSPENESGAREVRQRITKKLSSCIRSLQIRYITTDDVVTSEDDDANGLCIALEAAFIHGLKPKYIKRGGRNRGTHIPIPQPAFWALLKGITHRNVIKEIENVPFLSTDVGRCRSWLRIALNEGLVECYFITLRREKSRLMDFYQPCSLLLDAEDCDVVLSYLQGLSALPFKLSYKSALLCEWTTTPLILSGLWVEDVQHVEETPETLNRRKSLDSMSQSSSSDDTNSSMLQQSKETNESSSINMDTNSSSSQLSSSAGSDGQVNEQAGTTPVQPRSPELSSCEADTTETDESQKSQSEDIDLISPGSDKAFFSPMLSSSFHETIRIGTEKLKSLYQKCESKIAENKNLQSTTSLKPQPENPLTCANETPSTCETSASKALPTKPLRDPISVSNEAVCNNGKSLLLEPEPCPFVAEISKSVSWITEDDLDIPVVDLAIKLSDQENDQLRAAFEVIHRRRPGVPNPFQGLMMMGYLERRNALGLYKSFHCELTVYELRIFISAEERLCLENCTLLKCESVGPAQSDGRFELHFPGRKLCLRASSQDEAQDWVERIEEAIHILRPNKDEIWEVLKRPESPDLPKSRTSSTDESLPSSEVFNWISPFEVELDAQKEAILYMKIQKRWTQFIFSLSERVLRCFIPKPSEKALFESYSIEMIKDVLPDASLGSASCFRLVTSKGTLQLQAESPLEARTWRELVRAAYLEWEEDSAFVPGDGNFHIKSNIREHHLFQYLMYIPIERGLDAQDFKCAGCQRKIGFQFGKAKLCEFSSLYYCASCHHDQLTIIPSRIVHNWDHTERPVSVQAMNFLSMVENEPLFNVQYLNEQLYSHTGVMHELKYDRERLRLLAEFLITCRSGAIDHLNKRLNHRNYLLDCIHTYSMLDLKQVTTGVFERIMQTVLEFASDHIFECVLCSQKGFICMICNKDEIIYPFQLETTTRCADCKAVFHLYCKTGKKPCPRCKKRKSRQNQCIKM